VRNDLWPVIPAKADTSHLRFEGTEIPTPGVSKELLIALAQTLKRLGKASIMRGNAFDQSASPG
jgi:hypothetical protein